MTRSNLGTLALAAALAVAAGCGPGTVPVTGQVVYEDGQAAADLAGGSVVFDNGKVSSTGLIGSDGRFALSFTGQGDGALPGEYKVSVSPPDPAVEEGKPRPPRPIPAEYSDPERTPLTASVGAKTNDLTITVPRRKGTKRN